MGIKINLGHNNSYNITNNTKKSSDKTKSKKINSTKKLVKKTANKIKSYFGFKNKEKQYKKTVFYSDNSNTPSIANTTTKSVTVNNTEVSINPTTEQKLNVASKPARWKKAKVASKPATLRNLTSAEKPSIAPKPKILNRKLNIDKITSKQVSNTQINDTGAFSRARVGGKGAALHRIQNAGMKVPEFETIDVNLINNLEHHNLDINSLKSVIDDIENFSLTKVNIYNIKQKIQTLYANNPERRNYYLKKLSEFIVSDNFYNQIKGSQGAESIRQSYNKLLGKLDPNDAVIVRSSGIKEDSLGDAQAGKFESVVHGKADILQTCLEVLASGFQPNVCPVSAPQPMALIFQKCIDCSFGGVAMSRTSQNDSRCKIEFVPGQPKGGVSGLEGVTPYTYLVSNENKEFTSEFIEGNVTKQFSLNYTTANNFTEDPQDLAIDPNSIKLTDKQLKQIQSYIKLGEDMLLCPADFEFAIDKNGEVYAVQLRPLTVLTGGVNFAIEAPTDPMATGTLVSEGFCSGKLCYVKSQQDAESIPEGAIIVADHGEDWMLEDSFLKKVGGFVFKQGGTNDHVAITLRQQEKPCLIAKDQFNILQNSNEIVTMACCSFTGTSGAYIIQGNEFADKLTNMKSTVTANYEPRSSSAPKRPIPNLKFNRPDEAFKNLNDLNYRLLDFFAAETMMSRCFTEKGIMSLSMMPYRLEAIAEAKKEAEQMFAHFELFLSGYKQFLQLGIKPGIKDANLEKKLQDLTVLETQFKNIKNKVNNDISKIQQQFSDISKNTTNKGDFDQLLKNAQEIFTNIQKLNLPTSIQDINSLHDCIFWIHKEFIDALTPVALNSGLGAIKTYNRVDVIEFNNDNQQQVIETKCISEFNKLKSNNKNKIKMIAMEQATIATLQLGVHACTIEMLENAEAGKGRTLKVKLSDKLTLDDYDVYSEGKLQRFWFFTQLLQFLELSKNAGDIKATAEESTGILTIEIPHIETREAMLDKLPKLISSINSIMNLDVDIRHIPIKYTKWDFSKLKQRLANISSNQSKNDFLLYFILVSCNYKFYNITDKQLTAMLSIVDKLGNASNKFSNKIDQTELQKLINDIDANNQEPALKALLKYKNSSIIEFVRNHYPDWFTNKEKTRELVAINGLLLQYASDEIRNDLDIALEATKNNFNAIEYIDENLMNNKEHQPKLVKCIINIIDDRSIKKAEYLNIFKTIDLIDQESLLRELLTCNDDEIKNHIKKKHPHLVNEDD
jgi:phosphohistidine swiveling domain-containing protein